MTDEAMTTLLLGLVILAAYSALLVAILAATERRPSGDHRDHDDHADADASDG